MTNKDLSVERQQDWREHPTFSTMDEFLAKYSRGSHIGHGGNGVVYEVTRIFDGKLFAAKQVRRPPDCFHIIPGEIMVLTQVQDIPGVIDMVEYFMLPECYIIIMEHFDSKDLQEYILEHGILSEALTKDIFKQVLRAVIFCDTRGVFHGDIKAGNILINVTTGQTKLIDFGCSGIAPKRTLFHDYDGPHICAPPEWICQKEYTSEGLTVWTLGLLLFHLVNGDIPFETEEGIQRKCVRSLNRRKLSLNLQSLIDGCLMKKQDQRLTLTDMSNHPWIKSE